LSIILFAGLVASQLGNSGSAIPQSKTQPNEPRLSPSFNGITYSSDFSPRSVDEYLFGKNDTANIKNIGTDALHISGPSGWIGQSFSTDVYNLFENRSFLRNSDFSSGTASPDYWTNSTTSATRLIPYYDAANGWVHIWAQRSNSYNPGDEAHWTQTIYVNRSSIQGAQLQFKVWKNGANESNLKASVYVNSKTIWTETHDLLQTSAQIFSVNLTSEELPILPTNIVVILELSNPGGGNVRSNDKNVFFDDVRLYVNSQPYPESVQLKLGGQTVIGSDYGNGKVRFDPGTLPYDAYFTSNSTISLTSSSTILVHKSSSTGTTILSGSQTSTLISWHVNKSSALDQANQVFGSVQYVRYSFNVSIPFNWNFIDVRLPSGFQEGLNPGRIDRINNNSYTWIISVNVTAIGSYRPDPYTINANSNNYIQYANSIATFAMSTGFWIQRDFFGVGDRIMINATLQPSSSQGSAYIVFYSASDFSVWRDMSTLPTTPSSAGVVSFNFRWTDENVSRNSDLLVLTRWNNGSHVGVNWRTISFDLSPPQLSLSLSPPSYFIGGTVRIQVSCVDDYLIENVTLLIDGIPAKNWTFVDSKTLSANYDLNTLGLSDGPIDAQLKGWDHPGHINQTTPLTLFVDNTPPSAPTLSSPNDGDSVGTTSPTLKWAVSSDGSGSGVDHYMLQLDTSPLFNSSNLRGVNNIHATNYTVPDSSGLSFGTWYWRVSAVDSVGNMGAYSQARSFQIPQSGLPVSVLLGFAATIPTIAILLSVVYLRRRKKEPEEYDRKNLLVAYVFSRDGRAMFTYPFKEVKVEPQLVSGFLTAISEMMKEVVGGDKRPLRTIERSDAKIIIEFGTMVTGALVARKASREYRRRLKAFLRRFEDNYADKLTKWDGDQSVFQAAPEVVEEVFSDKTKVATYPTITGLEDLLFSEKLGGVAVSVQGTTGSGKTEFCLRYASSLIGRGKPVIMVAASLSPKDVREELRKNDVDVAKAEKAGSLVIYDAFSQISGIHSEEKHKFGSPGELNNMNLAVSKNLSELKNATIIFDSLTAMIDYSELELAVDFIRTIKAKISQGGHTAFFIIDSNALDKNQLNYVLTAMDGEIDTMVETTKKGEQERLVSFKRLKGFKVRPGYHAFK
jgi:KaiC/GvpD/RAD55 family RecA-like ATPase